MAHIKCRYNEIFCDNCFYRMNARAVLCKAEKCCMSDDYGYQWIAGEDVYMCKYAYPDIVEFEKTVKDYEYSKAENLLRIGKRFYSYIEYLEIDGRVLIDETVEPQAKEGKE